MFTLSKIILEPWSVGKIEVQCKRPRKGISKTARLIACRRNPYNGIVSLNNQIEQIKDGRIEFKWAIGVLEIPRGTNLAVAIAAQSGNHYQTTGDKQIPTVVDNHLKHSNWQYKAAIGKMDFTRSNLNSQEEDLIRAIVRQNRAALAIGDDLGCPRITNTNWSLGRMTHSIARHTGWRHRHTKLCERFYRD